MFPLEEILLETLSFYEPLIREHIILQMDPDKVNLNKELTNEDLDEMLKSLIKRKKVKIVKIGPDVAYIKLFPKKSLWKKLKSLF